MENFPRTPRLHPLAAGTVAAVMAASAMVAAAMGGYLTAECGVVLAVKEEAVMGKGSGVGALALAGGVAGALIGYEIGGSEAGTAVGAVMGGVAGHQLERGARSTKKYTLSVRMPDGSVRTASGEAPPALRAGDPVRLQDGVAKPR